jgi:hypothetical protein
MRQAGMDHEVQRAASNTRFVVEPNAAIEVDGERPTAAKAEFVGSLLARLTA